MKKMKKMTRKIFYQGGPYFKLSDSQLADPSTTVIARYKSGAITAASW